MESSSSEEGEWDPSELELGLVQRKQPEFEDIRLFWEQNSKLKHKVKRRTKIKIRKQARVSDNDENAVSLENSQPIFTDSDEMIITVDEKGVHTVTTPERKPEPEMSEEEPVVDNAMVKPEPEMSEEEPVINSAIVKPEPVVDNDDDDEESFVQILHKIRKPVERELISIPIPKAEPKRKRGRPRKYDFSQVNELSPPPKVTVSRSGRVRVPPVRHWLGERIKYEVGSDNLRKIVGVVRYSQKDESAEEEEKSESEEPKKEPFRQYEMVVSEITDIRPETFYRHCIHLDGFGKFDINGNSYKLESHADFVIPPNQRATINPNSSFPLRLLLIDYT